LGDLGHQSAVDVAVVDNEHDQFPGFDPDVEDVRVTGQLVEQGVRDVGAPRKSVFADRPAVDRAAQGCKVVWGAAQGGRVDDAGAGVPVRHCPRLYLDHAVRGVAETRVFLAVDQHSGRHPELERGVPVEPVPSAGDACVTDGFVVVRLHADH
tara:strand:- start:3316 stop:3774 length:459 start_codon:yes stop_codon:yes gene_type:complete